MTNPHQIRDQNHWRAFARQDEWSKGWKDYHSGTIGPQRSRWVSDDYRRAQFEAMELGAACAVTPKGPRAT